MTLSDPLIKDLKGRIRALVLSTGSEPFLDNDELVISLCIVLERIFSKGLSRRDGFTPWKVDSFQWFYQVVRKYHKILPLSFKIAFDEVLACQKIKTSIGKFRLLIRTCLKRRCLFVPVHLHVENQDYSDSAQRVFYDPYNSILGHEILSRIFLSLVQQLSLYNFELDLSNSAFLDEAWQVGKRIKIEIVPCNQLGLTLGFPLGYPVIVDILENSSAAEIQHLIGIGDIVDEINGICIRYYHGTKLDTFFRKIKSAPFKMTFIKGVSPDTGNVYLPLIKLYRILGLDPEKIAMRSHNDLGQSLPNKNEIEEEIAPEGTKSSVNIDKYSSSTSITSKLFEKDKDIEDLLHFETEGEIPSSTDPEILRDTENSEEQCSSLLETLLFDEKGLGINEIDSAFDLSTTLPSHMNDSVASALDLQEAVNADADRLFV